MQERIRRAWAAFTAAPHRMFFFGGIAQTLLAALWWLADLGGRYGGFYPPIGWSVPPTDAHAFLMVYTVFPFFIFGFLMTVYPRWMNGAEVPRRHYVPAFLLMAAGILLLYAALLATPALLAPAALLFLGGWGSALAALLTVYRRAQHPDKRHARITASVLALGWLLAAGWFSGVLLQQALLIQLARSFGIWLVLLPVFFTVSHRMIPFFSANVIPQYRIVRPDWPLMLVPAAGLLHAGMELTGATQWLWLADLPIAAAACYLSWVWRLRASLSVPLLAMLHIGFAWLGIATLISAAQSLAVLGGHHLLAKAPLHALTIGYFGSMLLGMVTRVTLGHSGRPLAADRLTWAIFLAFQLMAATRVAADLPGLTIMWRGQAYLAAAAGWLLCFGVWAWRYAPIYWRPRADGQPG